MSMRFRQAESSPPKTAIAVTFLALLLFGCSETDSNLTPPAGVNSTTATIQPPSALTMSRWSRSCASCHVAGVAGAPRTGNAADWETRLSKGKAVLLANTVHGIGKMPPLGYCSACEAEDFVAMIEFMAGQKLEDAP